MLSGGFLLKSDWLFNWVIFFQSLGRHAPIYNFAIVDEERGYDKNKEESESSTVGSELA